MPAVWGSLKELGEGILPYFAYINPIFICLPISKELMTKVKIALSLSLYAVTQFLTVFFQLRPFPAGNGAAIKYNCQIGLNWK